MSLNMEICFYFIKLFQGCRYEILVSSETDIKIHKAFTY